MARLTPALTAARLKVLKSFRRDLVFWFSTAEQEREERIRYAHAPYHTPRAGAADLSAKRDRARSALNRNMLAVKTALRDIGLVVHFQVAPPPMIGGRVEVVDPLTANLFQCFHDVSPVPMVLDLLEQAMGAYEHLASDVGLIHVQERTALDALQALMLGLRTGFQAGPPEKELAVHDVAQTILTSHGIEHTRDKEVVVVGDRSYKPDFHLVEFDVPIEFKLCDEKKPPNDIQEQIMADISAYSARWKHTIFIVYDVNRIASVERFCEPIESKFGVTVRVVKH